MNSKITLSVTLIILALAGFVPLKPGLFDANDDVGKPKITGSSGYDPDKKEYILKGAGYNIWFERDEFQYLFKEISGDFMVTADFNFVGKGTDAHRKVGWMVRETLDGDASHISAVVHGDGLTVLQWRVAKGEKMRDPEDEIFSKEKNTKTVQIVRKGNNYSMYAAAKGKPLQLVGSHVMDNLKDKVYVGMYICSHNPDVMEEARATNVKIVQDK